MSDYFVIGSPTSKNLAKKIAKKLQAKYLKATLRVFADGENKLTISGHVNKGTIIVVSSMGPPVDSNLIQTLSLISKSREISSNVIAVVPYMGYAKQDKEFLKGEIVTISVIAKLFKAAGATHEGGGCGADPGCRARRWPPSGGARASIGPGCRTGQGRGS